MASEKEGKMNLVFSYGAIQDKEFVAKGYKFLGAGYDENGKEAHAFEIEAILTCPKCGNGHVMKKVADKGEGKGPNGGTLCVMEDMKHAMEGYDFNIEAWKCPACGRTVYVGEKS